MRPIRSRCEHHDCHRASGASRPDTAPTHTSRTPRTYHDGKHAREQPRPASGQANPACESSHMAGQRIKALMVCARKVRRLSGSEKAPSGRQFGSKNETYPSAVGEPTYFSVNRINRRRGAHFWPRHGARRRRVSHNSSVPCCCNNLASRRAASTLRGLFAAWLGVYNAGQLVVGHGHPMPGAVPPSGRADRWTLANSPRGAAQPAAAQTIWGRSPVTARGAP